MKNKLFWKNKNVFITGGTGLLGPWLIKELINQQANIFVLVRDYVPSSQLFYEQLDKKVNVITGDLLNSTLLQRILNEFDIETVFHLGAQAIVGTANRSPISTFKSNIEGTWNLLEACRLSPWIKRIVIDICQRTQMVIVPSMGHFCFCHFNPTKLLKLSKQLCGTGCRSNSLDEGCCVFSSVICVILNLMRICHLLF